MEFTDDISISSIGHVVPDIEKEDVTDIVVDTSDFLKDIKAS